MSYELIGGPLDGKVYPQINGYEIRFPTLRSAEEVARLAAESPHAAILASIVTYRRSPLEPKTTTGGHTAFFYVGTAPA